MLFVGQQICYHRGRESKRLDRVAEHGLHVWYAQTWTRLYSLHEPSASAYALAWSPDGAGLVSGGSDGRLSWWDLRHGERVRVRKAHEGSVQALKVSPDGRRLASCGNDGAIRLWDLDSGEHLGTLRRDRPYERLTITGIRGLTQAEIATLRCGRWGLWRTAELLPGSGPMQLKEDLLLLAPGLLFELPYKRGRYCHDSQMQGKFGHHAECDWGAGG